MKTLVGFILLLCGFWLINSGYFKPMLLELGALSVALSAFLAWRMKQKDGAFYEPVLLSWRLPGYMLWMLWQIIKANIDVARRIWLGPSSISPALFNLSISQKTDIGRTIHANSITLTPGTLTLFVHDDEFEVHALTQDGARDLQDGAMDRRVTALEGS